MEEGCWLGENQWLVVPRWVGSPLVAPWLGLAPEKNEVSSKHTLETRLRNRRGSTAKTSKGTCKGEHLKHLGGHSRAKILLHTAHCIAPGGRGTWPPSAKWMASGQVGEALTQQSPTPRPTSPHPPAAPARRGPPPPPPTPPGGCCVHCGPTDGGRGAPGAAAPPRALGTVAARAPRRAEETGGRNEQWEAEWHLGQGQGQG